MHFPLFYNNFLSCQSTHFPQTLSQNMRIPMHSCPKESNGKSDLHFSLVTVQRRMMPRSDTCLHLQFGAMALANSSFPCSHLYGILVYWELEVASLGSHEHAPRSTACLSLLHQDPGRLHGLGRESWWLLDSCHSPKLNLHSA